MLSHLPKEHLTALMVVYRFVPAALPTQKCRNRQIMNRLKESDFGINSQDFKD